MGLFDKIKHSFGSGKLKKEQIDELNATVWRAVADGKITDEELEQINSYFYNSELSPEEVQNALADVFTQLVYHAVSDRRVSDIEFQSLEHFANRLSVSIELRQWMYQQIQYYRLFNFIESGGTLPIGQPQNLILQKAEVCHLCLPASLYDERVIRSNYQGGSRGVSIRIMKGVSYRVGASRGFVQAERGLACISQGYFIVTNQRLAFSGDKKSASTAFNKLLDFQVFADAIQYSVTNRQKPFLVGFPRIEDAELSALVISRIMND